MHIYRPVSSLLLMAAAVAAADVPAPIATATPAGSHSEVRADLERLRREALVTKPTSLLADPEAAKALAHLRSQLIAAQQSERQTPPFLQLAEDARSAVLALSVRDRTSSDQSEQELLGVGCLIDGGVSAEVTLAWLAERVERMGGQPTTAGAYAGWKNDEVFVGSAGKVIAFASALVYADWPARAGLVDAPKGAVGATADLTPFFQALTALIAVYPNSEERLAFKLLPDLATGSSRLTADLDVAGGWNGRVRLTGCGQLPVAAAIDPSVQARLGDRDASLTIALDPQAICDRMLAIAAIESNRTVEAIRADVDRGLTEQGLTLAQLTGIFTGTVAVGMTWREGPVPTVLGVFGVRDSAPFARLLEIYAGLAGGEATTVDGAVSAWTFAQLPVPITVVLGQDVLAISQDAGRATAALAKPAALPAAIANEVLVLEVAKSVMATGLKTGWNSLITIDETLARDNRNEASWFLSTCADMIEAKGADPLPATFTLLAGEQGEHLDNAAGSIRDAVAPGGGTSGLAFADASLTVLAGPLATDDQPMVACTVIWREADGYWSFDQSSYRVARLDQDALTRLLQDQPRRIGPDPASLPVLNFPNVPRIDAKCFPPLATVLRHLPERYRVSVSTAPDALEVHEQGLPVVTGLLGTLAVLSPAGTMEVQRQRLRREQQAKEEALEEKHSALIQSMEAAGVAVQRARDENKPLPEKASGLVDEFGLTLEAAAGLCGGKIPTDATALDQVGTWRPVVPEGAITEWIWRVQAEPGVSMLLYPWGTFGLVDDANIK